MGSTEIEEISASLAARFDSAWNERDADALAALFSEEADFQFYYGILVRGREKIRRYYRDKVFPYLEEGLQHITRKYRVRVLSEGVVLGDGRVDLVEMDKEGKEVSIQRRVKVTTVAVQEGKEWKFAAVRVMVPVK